MITLTENLSLEVLLGAAPTTQLPIYASYADYSDDAAKGKYDPQEKRTRTNGTNAVEAVPSPPAGVTRLVDFMTVRNSDAAAATVTVRIRDKSQAGKDLEYVILVSESIATGKPLQYIHGVGFT